MAARWSIQQIRDRKAAVAEWFHAERPYDESPEEMIATVVDTFVATVKRRGYNLCLPSQDIEKHMKKLTCTMYHHKPKRAKLPTCSLRPKGWTRECEEKWRDYVEMILFDSEWWMDFWESIEPGNWEYELPDWRFVAQIHLFSFVEREIDLLYDVGIFQDDGSMEDYDDAPYYEHDWN